MWHACIGVECTQPHTSRMYANYKSSSLHTYHARTAYITVCSHPALVSRMWPNIKVRHTQALDMRITRVHVCSVYAQHTSHFCKGLGGPARNFWGGEWLSVAHSWVKYSWSSVRSTTNIFPHENYPLYGTLCLIIDGVFSRVKFFHELDELDNFARLLSFSRSIVGSAFVVLWY